MRVLEQLLTDHIITPEEASSIKTFEQNKPMSVHWELRTILYLGVLLLISGLSILVYQNLDTIGHQAIIAAICLGCGFCFYYGYKRKMPFTYLEIKQISPVFDYVVLLGCLLWGVLIAYIQYQYSVFGLHYGIATLVPTILYFVSAYLFDHKGILSLGITGLAAWAGVSATPLQLIHENNFSELNIILSAIAVGLVLAGVSRYSDAKNIKEHFSFTYNNFAMNILFVATLTALFNEGMKIVSFIFLAAVCFYYIRYAIQKQSFLFLLLAVIYGYIGLTYSFFSVLINLANEFSIVLGMFFILASCVGVIFFFIYYKRILKIKK